MQTRRPQALMRGEYLRQHTQQRQKRRRVRKRKWKGVSCDWDSFIRLVLVQLSELVVYRARAACGGARSGGLRRIQGRETTPHRPIERASMFDSPRRRRLRHQSRLPGWAYLVRPDEAIHLRSPSILISKYTCIHCPTWFTKCLVHERLRDENRAGPFSHRNSAVNSKSCTEMKGRHVAQCDSYPHLQRIFYVSI